MLRSPRPFALATLALFFVASPPVHAYPISPVPLWDLVEQADLIVVAVVEEVVLAPPMQPEAEPRWDADVARLSVLEVWKGDAPEVVEVGFTAALICPAPPRYEVGRTVTAFLHRAEGAWQTVGLSYGSLYFAPSELAGVHDLVQEALVLQRGRVDPRRKVAWHVEAARQRATRWHGLYPLMPAADELHSYYDSTGRRPAGALTAEQLATIARGFVEDPAVDSTLPMVLAVLAGYRSRDVDVTAVAAVEALLAEKQAPWWTDQALVAVLERYGDRQAKARVKAASKDDWELDVAAARRMWQAARKRLGIPAVPPLRLEQPQMWGVGENTPS
jgi:hypothetical protein